MDSALNRLCGAPHKRLVVIGVHTPEFSFEKQPVNVENAVRDLKVT